VFEESVEVAGEVALEAAGCFASCLAFLEASFDVGDRGGVCAFAGDEDHVQDGPGMYDFTVTDIPVLAQLQPLANGSYPRNQVGIDDASEVFLTVSLAEPYERNDCCYKLVAAIVEVPS
jgi:hypothetical protein